MAERELIRMKRHGNLFEKIISFENLLAASIKAFRGKKDKHRAVQFYFNLEYELLILKEELQNRTYHPRQLRKFHIYEPKEREIAASDFRDRVVHHALCNIIEPLLEQGYIHHSYACRRGKGTHRAIRQAQTYSRKNCYYLKCDIKKYFASIDLTILKSILSTKFKDPDLFWLLNVIIDCAEADSPGKGVPIGNLTSQHFANLYLDRLDHYIKDSSRVKEYLRYMDDFLLFSNSKEKLHFLHSDIKNFLLSELDLELKEKATIIAPVGEGIPFLGFRLFPNLIRIKHENRKRTIAKLKSRTKAFESGYLTETRYSQSLMSITEHLRSGNTFSFRKDIFGRMCFQG